MHRTHNYGVTFYFDVVTRSFGAFEVIKYFYIEIFMLPLLGAGIMKYNHPGDEAPRICTACFNIFSKTLTMWNSAAFG